MSKNPVLGEKPDKKPSAARQITVLSTRKLKSGQRELLLNRGIGLVEMDFISIVPIPFKIEEIPENLIFTSQNSVKAILDHTLKPVLQQKKVFCVGEKTAAVLKRNEFNVVKFRDYGQDLALEIVNDHATEKFLFFCGKKRHDALPEGLKKAGVQLTQIEVYDTRAIPKKVDRIYDAVLFYSPSAVKSFCKLNDLTGSVIFCIGTTTAAEVEKHTNNFVLASTPTIENVIVQVVKYFEF